MAGMTDNIVAGPAGQIFAVQAGTLTAAPAGTVTAAPGAHFEPGPATLGVASQPATQGFAIEAAAGTIVRILV